MNSKRLLHFDLLRVVAAYFIVVLHMSVQFIQLPTMTDGQWNVANLFSAISRMGVPLFIMLSGMFMLAPEKKVTTSMIFQKYLPRLALIFLTWSIFYLIAFQDVSSWGDSEMGAKFILKTIILGHYHMWYLYMLAGLYLITPILRVFTQNASKQTIFYFLLLCVCITSITKLNEDLLQINFLSAALDKMSLTLVFGYVGYYLAGYAFQNFPLSKKANHTFYILGVISLAVTVLGTFLLRQYSGMDSLNLVFYSNYSPTLFLMSFALFLFTKEVGEHRTLSKGAALVAKRIPPYLLVVYLVHPFIIEQTRSILPTQSPWLLPVNGFIVFLLSLGISVILVKLWRISKKAMPLLWKPSIRKNPLHHKEKSIEKNI